MPWFRFIAISLFSPFVFAQGLNNSNGFFVEFGGGVSPMYVEEIIQDNALNNGITVTALYSHLAIGWASAKKVTPYLAANQNWYNDTANHRVMTGLIGLGLHSELPAFDNIYTRFGGGFAQKIQFGESESASGWGAFAGLGYSMKNQIGIGAEFNYLALSSSITDTTADSEAISSVAFYLNYRWSL